MYLPVFGRIKRVEKRLIQHGAFSCGMNITLLTLLNIVRNIGLLCSSISFISIYNEVALLQVKATLRRFLILKWKRSI